ncbi:hypothetical protein B6D08_14030 [Gilliamella apicola]|uniref:Uncharacterized protein n=1 Tax=Gilliamella apicola TaxID=1196095 RepID=A0A242ND56_9GAMM|nr:hypothetical protein B5S44_14065 [Gilliamella apicola]OTP87258.1 hypothetical protein B5S42_10945 [Gilliamella apicola]OTP97640.1 hypothetical protein B6D08_14030 [Gilliamella apicola]OTQ08095.1 hypothetical protein B6C91_13415 [Gilliamella apicola]OTQ10125.1 hypothetical protein B6C87_09135 [Gilliamella apicola]
MQVVTFDVADDVAVDVNLVQVAGAVIQVIDGAPIRQGGSDAIAQWVVLIDGGVGGIFADNTAIGIIAKVKPTRD